VIKLVRHKDAKEVIERLGRGESPESLGLKQLQNGFIDLSGIVVQTTKPMGKFHADGATFVYGPPPTFENIHLENVDLSRANLAYSLWVRCSFRNVHFANSKARGVNFTSSTMESARFEDSDLKLANWGMDRLNGPLVIDTLFVGCDLRQSMYAHPLFRNCRWVDCNLKGINFRGSRFEDCSFEGLLDEVWFRGHSSDPEPRIAALRNPMKNVDFSRAELTGVSFSHGIDLTSCEFPSEGYVRIFHPEKVYREALRRVQSNWPEGGAKERAMFYLEGMSEQHFPEAQPFTIIRESDFDDWPGAHDVGPRVLKVLKESSNQTL